MFLTSNFILSNELTSNMAIASSNISMMHKMLENKGITSDVIKLGNCLFIDKTSPNLPNNIRKGIYNYNYQDLTNVLPVSYMKKDFNISDADIKILISKGIIIDSFLLKGKKLVRFSDKFVNETKDCVFYMLSKTETLELYKNKTIDGYIELSNQSLTWYNIKPCNSIYETSF